MTLNEQQLKFARITELSCLMLESALLQRWESVIKMQTVRDLLIHEFFAEPSLLDEQSLAEGILHILKIDSELVSLATIERGDLSKELKKLSKGKHAIKAYGA